MAKFHVTYKSPDAPYECISEAKHEIPAGEVERVCDKFGIGEYLTIELDTEAMTCVIVPEKRRSSVKSDEYYAALTAEWQEEHDAEAAEIKKWDDLANEPKGEDFIELVNVPHPGLSTFRTRGVDTTDNSFEGETVTRMPIPNLLPYRLP